MDKHADFPTPEDVDDQIERLFVEASDYSPAARLVRDLHTTYRPYAAKDAHSLERVWERLADHKKDALSSSQHFRAQRR